MKRPNMVIFDAGETLINYLAFDTLKGTRNTIPYVTKNPGNLTAEAIDECMNRITAGFLPSRKQGFEVAELTIIRLVSDLLGIEYSVSDEQVERLIWETTPVIHPVPHVGELLQALNAAGIRTAVISNFELSSCLLKESWMSCFRRTALNLSSCPATMVCASRIPIFLGWALQRVALPRRKSGM